MPLDRGASGRVLLAFSDGVGEPHSDVKEKGYAVSRGERDPEVAAVSVPLIAKSGRLVGALSVSGLITRFGEERHEALVSALKESKQRLSEKIST
nr:IclR family transcriptional regulator C-terminal domain-containing protein [Ruegeria arenilitoris]